ncbi:metallophosphoesterase [Castellaniella ginsengisoli]|uniref:Metallophosphoesterase family protein n=1 Tax=Castellaniella ginsengisoli TaxID=546114 RepID=A0AB39E640_9BURK
MIAILSDIHSNLAALRAVLDDARTRGCTRILSLGDVVGYHAQPGPCIDLLAQHDAINILGNHDHYLISEENCSRSKVVARIIDYQKRIVTPAQLTWLQGSLPSLRESGSLFVHGGPEDPRDQYLYVIDDDTVPEDVDRLFSGHTHVQALMPVAQGKWYCNPGSVGQPRDGDSRAAYAIFDGDRIELRRVAYNIEETVESMKEAGFEPFLYENLYHGAQIGGRIDKIKYINRNKRHESN